MGKYLVIGYRSKGEVAIFNIVDGGPPVRHSFPVEVEAVEGEAASLNVQRKGSADLLCDEYQIFFFGKIPRTDDSKTNRLKYCSFPNSDPDSYPAQRVLNVVDFLLP